ncbi:unnamed protein product, partial [Sphacelaria rigidula]
VSRTNLNENDRSTLIDVLLKGSNSGKLTHGDIKRVAQRFGCSSKQVLTVWKHYKEKNDAGFAALSLRNERAGNSTKISV